MVFVAHIFFMHSTHMSETSPFLLILEVTSVPFYAQKPSDKLCLKQAITSKHLGNSQGTNLKVVIGHFSKWEKIQNLSHILSNQATGNIFSF